MVRQPNTLGWDPPTILKRRMLCHQREGLQQACVMCIRSDVMKLPLASLQPGRIRKQFAFFPQEIDLPRPKPESCSCVVRSHLRGSCSRHLLGRYPESWRVRAHRRKLPLESLLLLALVRYIHSPCSTGADQVATSVGAVGEQYLDLFMPRLAIKRQVSVVVPLV